MEAIKTTPKPISNHNSKKLIFTPEDAFLQNDPLISHKDMADYLISRSRAIIDALSLALQSNDIILGGDTIDDILGQVSCNLEQLKIVTERWPEAKN